MRKGSPLEVVIEHASRLLDVFEKGEDSECESDGAVSKCLFGLIEFLKEFDIDNDDLKARLKKGDWYRIQLLLYESEYIWDVQLESSNIVDFERFKK